MELNQFLLVIIIQQIYHANLVFLSTLPVPIPDKENKIILKFLFSHFLVVPQKVLLRLIIVNFELFQRTFKGEVRTPVNVLRMGNFATITYT